MKEGRMTELVRRADIQDEIDRWLDSVGTIMVGKGLSSYGELIGCVEDAPAADVAPVRHSYWESYDIDQFMGTDEWGDPKWRRGRFYICHNRRCRRKTAVKSNYCPNCGAKME